MNSILSLQVLGPISRSIDDSEFAAIKNATSESQLKSIWGEIADWFCRTNKEQAKVALYRFMHADNFVDQLDKFVEIHSITSNGWKGEFEWHLDKGGSSFRIGSQTITGFSPSPDGGVQGPPCSSHTASLMDPSHALALLFCEGKNVVRQLGELTNDCSGWLHGKPVLRAALEKLGLVRDSQAPDHSHALEERVSKLVLEQSTLGNPTWKHVIDAPTVAGKNTHDLLDAANFLYQRENNDKLKTLPPEIFSHLASFLPDRKDLRTLQQVDTRTRDMTSDEVAAEKLKDRAGTINNATEGRELLGKIAELPLSLRAGPLIDLAWRMHLLPAADVLEMAQPVLSASARLTPVKRAEITGFIAQAFSTLPAEEWENRIGGLLHAAQDSASKIAVLIEITVLISRKTAVPEGLCQMMLKEFDALPADVGADSLVRLAHQLKSMRPEAVKHLQAAILSAASNLPSDKLASVLAGLVPSVFRLHPGEWDAAIAALVNADEDPECKAAVMREVTKEAQPMSSPTRMTLNTAVLEVLLTLPPAPRAQALEHFTRFALPGAEDVAALFDPILSAALELPEKQRTAVLAGSNGLVWAINKLPYQEREHKITAVLNAATSSACRADVLSSIALLISRNDSAQRIDLSHRVLDELDRLEPEHRAGAMKNLTMTLRRMSDVEATRVLLERVVDALENCPPSPERDANYDHVTKWLSTRLATAPSDAPQLFRIFDRCLDKTIQMPASAHRASGMVNLARCLKYFPPSTDCAVAFDKLIDNRDLLPNEESKLYSHLTDFDKALHAGFIAMMPADPSAWLLRLADKGVLQWRQVPDLIKSLPVDRHAPAFHALLHKYNDDWQWTSKLSHILHSLSSSDLPAAFQQSLLAAQRFQQRIGKTGYGIIERRELLENLAGTVRNLPMEQRTSAFHAVAKLENESFHISIKPLIECIGFLPPEDRLSAFRSIAESSREFVWNRAEIGVPLHAQLASVPDQDRDEAQRLVASIRIRPY